ncbi:MAG: proline racemase family protein [Lachnospiraceae bacterium]|jgi:proline racemase|nr:proline racemase family protein [Lachnospiraceae bacterium]
MKEALQSNVDFSKFEAAITAIDTHTEGEFTRVIIGGFPEPEGDTMTAKRDWLIANAEKYRTALMNEPRGHQDMFGALLTEPVHEEADFGVIFMESTGYVNMCGHGTIGTSTALVEGKLIPVTEPYTYINLDAPAGLIRVKVRVEDGHAKEVTLVNVPSFLYKENLKINIEGKEITYDIAFGGSFFAMVDIRQFEGLTICPKNIPEITRYGMEILEKSNKDVSVFHPEVDITSIDVCEFYGPPDDPKNTMRNVVIFGNNQADRSPCGTGTSAKLGMLYARKEIGIGEEIINESFLGSQFRGVILSECKVGEYAAVIPQITGYANVTGVATYLVDGNDPLRYGFMVG